MFREPHFVALYPFVFVGGGNMVEHDVVIYVPGRLAAVELVSKEDEPLAKQLRHRQLWRRFVEVHFCRGGATAKHVGLGIGESGCDEVCELAREVPGAYFELVRLFYGVFPDLGHLNYFFATSSPDYLEELWVDLEEAGEALRDDVDEFYRLLGEFLVEKAKASRGEYADSGNFESLSRLPQVPRDEPVVGDVAVVFMPLRRRGEPLAHLLSYVAAAVEATRGCREVYVVDGDVVKEVGNVKIWKRKKDGEELPDPARLIVVREFEKEKFDKYLNESLKKFGVVQVVYVPEYAVYYRGGDTAPTTDLLLPEMAEFLEEAERLIKVEACDGKLPKQKPSANYKLSPAPFYVTICTS
ncbi:MAG: hypothetical protein QXP31_07945 [Pyrobaculum sp.]